MATNSRDSNPFNSYEEFVAEVFATRDEVKAWDPFANKTTSVIGHPSPHFYSSLDATLLQSDALKVMTRWMRS